MPLGLYLYEGQKAKEDQLISRILSCREIIVPSHGFDAQDACWRMGISLAPLYSSDSNIDYQSQVYSLSESVIYRSSSLSGWKMKGNLNMNGYGLSICGAGHGRWGIGKPANTHSQEGIIQDLESLEEVIYSELSESHGMFFSRECLVRALSSLIDAPLNGRLEFSSAIPTNSYALNAIKGIIGIIICGLKNDAPLKMAPIALTNLHQAAVHLILEELPHNYSKRFARFTQAPTPRQIKRAIDFILANLATPITLSDIAAAAAISIRTLQVGFRKYKGITPTGFVRFHRLYKVRDDLLNATISSDVKQIALAWGFANYYLFAKNYKKQFGESPLLTMEKRGNALMPIMPELGHQTHLAQPGRKC